MASGRADPGDHHPLADLPLEPSRAADGSVGARFERLRRTGARDPLTRGVPVEQPIAVEVGGVGYAVMMATPIDLVDFGYGFSLAERLADVPGEIVNVEAHELGERRTLLRVTLVPERQERVLARVRHRTSDASCGLCGVESLEQALRPLPPLPASQPPAPSAVFAALDALRAYQPLNAATGAAHAAALVSVAGAIRLVREDVGRHNAFDKLIGAMARAGLGWDGGFALLTARCSYELVEKAVLARCPALVTISMASDLAIATAREARLRLVVLARADAVLELPLAGEGASG